MFLDARILCTNLYKPNLFNLLDLVSDREPERLSPVGAETVPEPVRAFDYKNPDDYWTKEIAIRVIDEPYDFQSINLANKDMRHFHFMKSIR